MQSTSRADPIGIVKALYSAAACRDLDEMMALAHPDIVAVEAESLPYGGEYRGKQNVRSLFTRIGEAFSEYTCSDFQYLGTQIRSWLFFAFKQWSVPTAYPSIRNFVSFGK